MQTLKQKVAQGLVWSLAGSASNKFVTLLLFMVLARLLDQHDLGVFSAAIVILNFLALFVDQGLGDAIVQKSELNERQINAIFVINLVVAILMFGLLWVGAPELAASMKIPELVNILRVGGVAILIGALCFSQQAMHRRHFNYRWLAIGTFASTVLGGSAAIYLARQGYGPWALVVQTIVGGVVIAAMLWVKPQWPLALDFDFKGVQGMFSYGANRLGTNVLDFASSRYIEFFLAAVLGPVALGIYSVGVRVYQALMQALSSAVLDVAHNAFSRLAHDREELLAAYYKSMTATAAIVVPLFLMLAMLAPEATLVLFGPKWADSADVMKPMALLGAVQALQFYNGTIFNALGKPSIGFALAIFKTIFAAVMLWLAKDSGLTGVVQAYVASQLLAMPLSFYLAKTLIGVSLRQIALRIWPYLFACIMSSVAIFWVGRFNFFDDQSSVFRLVVLGFSGLLAYIACILVVARPQMYVAIALVRGR